ncbi:MAG: flagellar assembly protein FliX [Devosia sp.]|uniref:flagellar assembly protein FliX n=1 Tax=Devosia sp. TaxID=1871048 RepID=UPI0024C555AC|nr:flagellar assembly protein FliX [Devosia sp.]UYO00681.1 MAG: flagellar assembly protein FliX [Devosia sp.]
MRIDATHRSNGVSGRNAAGRSGGPAFVPADGQDVARPGAAAPVAPAAELDAILALQSVGDIRERRRKSVRRGRQLLDDLESLKADLLVGDVGTDRLDAIAAQLGQLRDRVEPGLDALMDDIELRVRVELAKRGRFPPV